MSVSWFWYFNQNFVWPIIGEKMERCVYGTSVYPLNNLLWITGYFKIKSSSKVFYFLGLMKLDTVTDMVIALVSATYFLWGWIKSGRKKRQSLCLLPLTWVWLCDLLWPVEHNRTTLGNFPGCAWNVQLPGGCSFSCHGRGPCSLPGSGWDKLISFLYKRCHFIP